jgi:tetratricopeptide (TPR) repeat protein
MGAVLANSQQYASALQHYDRAMKLENGIDCPRLFYNRAVSLMCSKYYVEAAKELLKAINAQLPARPVTESEESAGRYYSTWDTLRTCIEASDLPAKDRMLYACEAHDGNAITVLLP